MLNVKLVDYVYELIEKELNKRKHYLICSRSFEELLAMRTVVHMFRTLMVGNWSEGDCKNYINDMLNF
jgi:hypothetical protein